VVKINKIKRISRTRVPARAHWWDVYYQYDDGIELTEMVWAKDELAAYTLFMGLERKRDNTEDN
jgi:hypothetical protein